MMQPEDVGPRVVRGIRETRLHIFTHLNARPQLERRFAAILADFEAEERARGERERGPRFADAKPLRAVAREPG
jgi:hypothetical protein